MAYTYSQEPEVDGHFHILLIQKLGNLFSWSPPLTLKGTVVLNIDIY